MFDFFDDFFHFFVPHDLDSKPSAKDDSNPVETAAHDVFDLWQDGANDFFTGLDKAADDWGKPAEDFVSSWQKATESFAGQFAHWFGWSSDDSPV
jgi:hypothetical protein